MSTGVVSLCKGETMTTLRAQQPKLTLLTPKEAFRATTSMKNRSTMTAKIGDVS